MKYNYLLLIVLVFLTSCNTVKNNKILTELTKRTEDYNKFKLNNFKNELLSVENTAKIDDTFKSKYQDIVIFNNLTENYYKFLDSIKYKVKANLQSSGKKGTSSYLQKEFFNEKKITQKGKHFLDKLGSFKSNMDIVLRKKYQATKLLLDSLFNVKPVKISGNKTINWLPYQFMGVDNVTALANLTLIQSNIVAVKSRLMSHVMGDEQFSENAYKVDVVLEKSKFYPGEEVKGKLFINKSAENLMPKNVFLNGKVVDNKFIKEGEVNVEFKAPKNTGEYPIDGKLTISQGNLDLTLYFNKTFEVIKKASVVNNNSTQQINNKNVAASKTNNISKTKANANLGHPEINIRGKAPDSFGIIKLTRGSFKVSTIDAIIPNSDESVIVTEFSFKAPNQPTLKIYGNKLNRNAIVFINKSKRGRRFKIFNVKLRLKSNPNYRFKSPKTVSVEIID